MEATLTQPRTYLEIHLKNGELTQNKQLNKSKRKSLKTLYTWKNQLQHNLPTPAQQKTRGGRQKDPPKKDPRRTKNKRHTQSQHRPQLKISKIRRSRKLYH